MIEAAGIRKRYDEFSLEIAFAVSDGEILTLLGASGSGKTTTLRILAGFEAPEAGRITVDGRDVTHLTPQRRRLGYVFQDYTLFPHLSVGENVAYGLRVQRVPRPERVRRVTELLRLVGLAEFATRPVQTLSGGEQQRVALARALAVQPRALLLDEPFSAVDTERREELRRYLVKVKRRLGTPMVFVTHSRSEALALSDRLVVLRDGRVEDQGDPKTLYERPGSEYSARFLGKANIFSTEELAAFPAGTVAGAVRNRPADGALLLIRPEQLVLSDGRGLAAQVVHGSYYGAYHDYELETAFGSFYLQTRERLALESRVTLRLPAEHLVVIGSHE